jgi:hypothetical protein
MIADELKESKAAMEQCLAEIINQFHAATGLKVDTVFTLLDKDDQYRVVCWVSL